MVLVRSCAQVRRATRVLRTARRCCHRPDDLVPALPADHPDRREAQGHQRLDEARGLPDLLPRALEQCGLRVVLRDRLVSGERLADSGGMLESGSRADMIPKKSLSKTLGDMHVKKLADPATLPFCVHAGTSGEGTSPRSRRRAASSPGNATWRYAPHPNPFGNQLKV